ncbi:hypothetical protein VTL71DRAFT_3207 [Oculimacula yallundae]|uniref:Uncharacterized protein n=1 Tax=Oculimacula yallundae TaxID=86028 RepID=A0ABR4C7P0_9HELO
MEYQRLDTPDEGKDSAANVENMMELPFYPRAARLPLKQTMFNEQWLKRILKRASRRYPALPENDFALENYGRDDKIEGLFFLGDDGERKVWGPDCDYFHKKSYKGLSFKEYLHIPGEERYFFHHSYNTTLAKIDKPKPAADRHLVAHCSEKGWNVASSKDTHIMKLPQEIRNLIIKFVLCVDHPQSLQPLTVTCNLRDSWSQPHYEIIPGTFPETTNISTKKNGNQESQSMIEIPRQDCDGSYVELRTIKRAAIDASCLRTCKAFQAAGTEYLYGLNNFYFNVPKLRSPYCKFSFLHPKDTELWQPDPFQPQVNDEYLNKVTSAIGDVRHHVSLKSLPGWVAYDPFLRFLWSIGPEKAALLKSLKFCGNVKLHECEEAYCDDCQVTGLIESLRIYILFIINLCPMVESLTLYAGTDELFVDFPQMLPVGFPTTRDEALTTLFENEVRQIPGLKDLIVLDGFRLLMQYQDIVEVVECAEPTRAWLKKRNIQAVRKSRKAEMAKALLESQARLEEKEHLL